MGFNCFMACSAFGGKAGEVGEGSLGSAPAVCAALERGFLCLEGGRWLPLLSVHAGWGPTFVPGGSGLRFHPLPCSSQVGPASSQTAALLPLLSQREMVSKVLGARAVKPGHVSSSPNCWFLSPSLSA